MAFAQVKRRDGEVVGFDRSRIESAIEAACDAVGDLDKAFIPALTDDVIHELMHAYEEKDDSIPSVEEIQDLVEKHLMKWDRYEVAKAYILYRERQTEKREEKKAAAPAAAGTAREAAPADGQAEQRTEAPAPRRYDFGSPEDFQLQQALNHLKGLPVETSKKPENVAASSGPDR
mgnify:CR=1 FL=1